MYSEQLGHFTSVGAVAFQTLERLLFFLALPVLLAGTAISIPPYYKKQVSFYLFNVKYIIEDTIIL